MGIRGDGCRGVGGSVIPTIPPHLCIPFSYIYMMMTRGCNPLFVTVKMRSCQENKILTDSSTEGV